jgi:hypothetical protein
VRHTAAAVPQVASYELSLAALLPATSRKRPRPDVLSVQARMRNQGAASLLALLYEAPHPGDVVLQVGQPKLVAQRPHRLVAQRRVQPAGGATEAAPSVGCMRAAGSCFSAVISNDGALWQS